MQFYQINHIHSEQKRKANGKIITQTVINIHHRLQTDILFLQSAQRLVTFCQSVLWGASSFDLWSMELSSGYL